MTVGHVVQHYIKSLSEIYDEEEAKAIMRFVMKETLEWSHAELLLNSEETISEVKANTLAYYLVRLMKHEPVQYVLKTAYFDGMKFFIDRNVLIPRPETEELVEWIYDEYRSESPSSILDIGTGSGCIAVALKKKFPHAAVYAIDSSEASLRIAERNAESNSAEVKFLCCDIMNETAVSDFRQKTSNILFNIIVSNPPYVLGSERLSLAKNVLFEPMKALFVPNDDPLIFYKQIISVFTSSLKSSGSFYFEINPLRAKELKEWMHQHNFSSLILKKDLSGNERMLKICR